MIRLDLSHVSEERKIAFERLMEDNLTSLKNAQKGEEKYIDSLGWLDTDTCASGKQLSVIQNLADNIRKNADCFVIVGVGGSNNAARSVIYALKDPNGPEIVYAGNTLSPDSLSEMLKVLETKKSVYIDVIAKNFETLEPGSSFRLLRKFLYDRYGEEAPKHIVCTGTINSSLNELCDKEGYTFIDFPLTVGGRFTAMTNVGLLPMAVAGIDIRELVQGARDMRREVMETPFYDNIAYKYACLRNSFYNEGYRVELLSTFEPRFRWFFKWWEQLFAESEGKDGKGLFPKACEFSEELHSVGQYIQEGSPILFETFLTVKEPSCSLVITSDNRRDYFDYLNDVDFRDINTKALEATVKAHSDRLPVLILEIDRLDAYHFGQIFYFYQFMCYVSAGILGVNPFDQPGVEAYKKWMFKALGK